MKKLILLLIAFIALKVEAQTITTAYPPANTIVANGLTYVTFAIRNNNAFPVVLTNLTNLQANVGIYENNIYKLWYSATSLGGPPLVATPVWTVVATSEPKSSNVFPYYETPFNCIGLTIPPNTMYRFALEASKGTVFKQAVAPNIFTSGNIDLLVGNNIPPTGQVGYAGIQNVGYYSASFFDGSVTLSLPNSFTDIQVFTAGLPANICSGSTNLAFAQICNKSPNIIDLATNPITVNYNITGPVPAQTPTVNLLSGTLAPCACTLAVATGINYTEPGTYYTTTTASITGLTDVNLANNTKTDSVKNYKPTVTPTFDSICQYTNGTIYPGFNAAGCMPRNFTSTILANVNSPQQPEGSSDATASLFATGTLPTLPAGAVIIDANLLVTNLNCQPPGNPADEARFNIYGPPPNGPASPFLPGSVGYAYNFSFYNFDYSTVVSAAVINNMYAALGAGGTFSVGSWNTVNNYPGPDHLINAQGIPTQVTLKINYTITPIEKWYVNNVGGSSILTGSPFNPFMTPGSGLTNTNTVGNYFFYASCSADSNCRVPVQLKINPSPIVNQDSLAMCELIPSTGNSMFDLTTLSLNVANNDPNATVNYYQDAGLTQLINNPATFNSATTIIYSSVALASGCSSSDSVILTVNAAPEFTTNIFQPFACAPYSLDVATLIDPFSTVPPGTDTLYYTSAWTPHPNPHNVTTIDTVYMVFVTNTIPACTDTAVAQVNIQPASNQIVNQNGFNTSDPGSVGCNSFTLSDGNTEILLSPNDCKKIVQITDVANATSMGSTSVCEEIDGSTQYHNGQPYVNRHYQITPTNQTNATVCLYFLDDDFAIYNSDAIFNGWPQINPNVNLCISKVSNGDINDPGHTAVSIPNASITATYDPGTTVWTLCFPVDSFSYFYCHTCNPVNAPLPVNLLSFTGKKVDNTSQLDWVTTSEQNNSHFILEHSRDGKSFSALSDKIPSLAPNGNSNVKLDYGYVDHTPYSGYNYYRLQQVDIDNKISYSQIIKVYHGDETLISLYPNPVNTQLNIEINTPKGTLAQVSIVDATGRTVRMIDMQLQAGNNRGEVSMEGLADGMYMIKVTNDKGLNFSQTVRKN